MEKVAVFGAGWAMRAHTCPPKRTAASQRALLRSIGSSRGPEAAPRLDYERARRSGSPERVVQFLLTYRLGIRSGEGCARVRTQTFREKGPRHGNFRSPTARVPRHRRTAPG